MNDNVTSIAWNDYFEKTKHMFSIIENCKVLEIATGHGKYWQHYELYNPKSITGLDPDTRWPVNKEIAQHIIRKDVFDYLHEKPYYDAIICYGLLYKLHSPINLFEKICRCNPKFVLIETILNTKKIFLEKIQHNRLGDLVTEDLTSHYAIHLTDSIIKDVFLDLGYELVKEQTVHTTEVSKLHVMQLNFKRMEQNV